MRGVRRKWFEAFPEKQQAESKRTGDLPGTKCHWLLMQAAEFKCPAHERSEARLPRKHGTAEPQTRAQCHANCSYFQASVN